MDECLVNWMWCSRSTWIGVSVVDVWSSLSTCPRTATCRWNLLLDGGMMSECRGIGWVVGSSTMMKYEELVRWRSCHVVGSGPPVCGVPHVVWVLPIEGGSKVLGHEVESLAVDGICLGM